MCLYADQYASRPICPRTYYKIVGNPGRVPFFYPDSGVSFQKGEIVKAHPEMTDYHLDWFRKRKYTLSLDALSHRVAEGAIHVFTNLKDAELQFDDLICRRGASHFGIFLISHFSRVPAPTFELIRVRCLPEHWIAYGLYGDAAYTQVEVLD